jgi:hypothetical protein
MRKINKKLIKKMIRMANKKISKMTKKPKKKIYLLRMILSRRLKSKEQ